jgi:hypothetical protein
MNATDILYIERPPRPQDASSPQAQGYRKEPSTPIVGHGRDSNPGRRNSTTKLVLDTTLMSLLKAFAKKCIPWRIRGNLNTCSNSYYRHV